MVKKFEEEVIKRLPYPECVRKRMGLWLSDNGRFAVNTCLREIQDNSIDEINEGYGDTIYVSNNFNGYSTVWDNGRGIPIAMNFEGDKTQAYMAISELHSGSKFEATDKVRTGMHGVGSAVVASVSDIYILLSKITEYNYNRSIPEVKAIWESSGSRSKKDLYYIVVMEKGYKTFEGAGHLKDIEEKIFNNKNYKTIPQGFSTLVFFKLDPTVFECDNIVPDISSDSLQYFLLIQHKFYNRKIRAIVNDEEITDTFKPYKFEFTDTIVPKDTSLNKKVGVYVTFEADPKLGPKIEFGSVNGLVVNQGVHINYIEAAYKQALKNVFKIKHEYLANGIKMCVVLLAGEVLFDSQTKTRLKSISKVKVTDFGDIVKDFEKIFRKNSDYWNLHITKLNQYADSITKIGAIAKAQKIIDAASGGGSGLYKLKSSLIDGFVDATAPSGDRWNCSLLVTEGLSPAGSLKSARKAYEVKYYSICPLRGKVLDVSDCTADKMMNNDVFFTLYSMMGLGIQSHSVIDGCKTPEEAYEIIKKKTRFGKLIICTD